MTPDEVVAFVWRQYGVTAKVIADSFGVPHLTVLAVICQESLGDTCAVRVERGFFKRYYQGLLALVRRTVGRRDDRWFEYPDLFSASYGLMQVMYPVVLENGSQPAYPTSLCQPEYGIQEGCRHLRKKMDQARKLNPGKVGDALIREALLRYNGGGDPQYPDKVFGWRDRFKKLVPAGGNS